MTDLHDLRDYLTALDELGDLRKIDREVDPDLEVGATVRLSYSAGHRRRCLPALPVPRN